MPVIPCRDKRSEFQSHPWLEIRGGVSNGREKMKTRGRRWGQRVFLNTPDSKPPLGTAGDRASSKGILRFTLCRTGVIVTSTQLTLPSTDPQYRIQLPLTVCTGEAPSLREEDQSPSSWPDNDCPLKGSKVKASPGH